MLPIRNHRSLILSGFFTHSTPSQQHQCLFYRLYSILKDLTSFLACFQLKPVNVLLLDLQTPSNLFEKHDRFFVTCFSTQPVSDGILNKLICSEIADILKIGSNPLGLTTLPSFSF